MACDRFITFYNYYPHSYFYLELPHMIKLKDDDILYNSF